MNRLADFLLKKRSVKRARSPDEWKYSTCYAGTERNKETRVVVGGLSRRRIRGRESGHGGDGGGMPKSAEQPEGGREGAFDSAKTVRFSRR